MQDTQDMREGSAVFDLERRLVVVTPEQVELRFETAGLGSRTAAHLIDWLILILVHAALGLGAWLIIDWTGAFTPDWLEEYGAAALIIVFAVLGGGYFLIGEFATNGRTIGKRALGLRVIQDNGRPLSFLSSAIRNLLRVVDMLPGLYFAGGLTSFLHPHDKRLGDVAAGTAVVYEASGSKRKRKRTEKQLAKWRPLYPGVEVEAWAKHRVNEEEWALLEQFAERLPSLSPKRSAQLAEGIVDWLAPKLGIAERWEDVKSEAAKAEEAYAAWIRGQRPASAQPKPMEPAAEEGAGTTEQPKAMPAGRPQPPSKRPSHAVAWALFLYEALRPDWEFHGFGGES